MLADTFKPVSILVVDDDPSHRQAAGHILHAAGYHVQTCENGREAIDRCLVQAQLPDLILMSLQLPTLGGDETAWFLRHEDATTAIPIIGLTKDEERLADPKIRALFDRLLTIPCNRKALLETLDETLVPASGERPR